MTSQYLRLFYYTFYVSNRRPWHWTELTLPNADALDPSKKKKCALTRHTPVFFSTCHNDITLHTHPKKKNIPYVTWPDVKKSIHSLPRSTVENFLETNASKRAVRAKSEMRLFRIVAHACDCNDRVHYLYDSASGVRLAKVRVGL